MLPCIVALAISLSIDALVVGITYGIKGTKIPFVPKFVMCIFSVIYSGISIAAGHFLSSFISKEAGNIVGSLILGIFGLYTLIKALKKPDASAENTPQADSAEPKTILSLFIKSLGITIQILKNPIAGDIDSSGMIDLKESFFIGLALSLDSIGVGIGSSLIGLGVWYCPLIIGLFQFIFISGGLFFGESFRSKVRINEKYLNASSGGLLLVLSILKLI